MGKATERCVVCGKVVEGRAVRIAKGQFQDGHWIASSVWGHAHEACFAKAVPSPDLTMKELRRAAGSTEQTPR
jgi:hypothetical protein